MRSSLLALGLLLSAVSSSRAQDPAPTLLKLLPTNVNSISIIRVDEIMKSERAVAEKWKDSQDAAFLAGSGRIPPWVSTLVRGTEIRSFSMGPMFSVSLVPKPADIALEKLLPKDKIDYDQIGQTMVWRSSRGYMAEVLPGVLGVMGPPNRQSFAYWLRTITAADGTQYSPYLQQVTKQFKPQVLSVIDLHDFFNPNLITNRVMYSQALAGKTEEGKALVALLLKLRRARIGIDVKKEITLGIAFDFDAKVGAEANYIKPLLSEILDDAGTDRRTRSSHGQSRSRNGRVVDAVDRRRLASRDVDHPDADFDGPSRVHAVAECAEGRLGRADRRRRRRGDQKVFRSGQQHDQGSANPESPGQGIRSHRAMAR
ncbi:MAG: hypothetical protein QM811_02830 [Pirellulales bacterium]